MKIRKLISIVLLAALSFSTMHAFAISFLDDDHCSVTEYVHEINAGSEHEIDGDVCDVHHEFHTLFLLPETIPVTDEYQPIATELSAAEYYTFYLQTHVLQPPITHI